MTLLVWLQNLIPLFALAFWMHRKADPVIRHFLIPAFIVKLAAGIGMGWLYTYYYPSGDTFTYFDQAWQSARTFFSDPGDYLRFLWRDDDLEWKGISRSLFFVKVVSVPAIAANGNYWITSLWLSTLAFLAAWYLFTTVTRVFKGSVPSAAFAFLFFPSVVFWGSGVIKESVALAGLMILARLYLKTMMGVKPRLIELVLSLFSLWMVWQLKYYWVSVFLPVTFSALCVHSMAGRFQWTNRMQIPVWLLIFFVLCLSASLLHPNFHPQRIFQVVIENNHAFSAISDPSDLAYYGSLEKGWPGILLDVPWALVSGLFRPFLWESASALKFLAAAENTLFLVLSLSALQRVRELGRSPNRLITLSVLLYAAILCVFLALSTPNFGSLARYRIGFMPFLVFVVTFTAVPRSWFQIPRWFRSYGPRNREP